MNWEPAESKDNDDNQNHFDDTLLILDAICRCSSPRGLIPETVQHDTVEPTDQEEWKDIRCEEERHLNYEEDYQLLFCIFFPKNASLLVPS